MNNYTINSNTINGSNKSKSPVIEQIGRKVNNITSKISSLVQNKGQNILGNNKDNQFLGSVTFESKELYKNGHDGLATKPVDTTSDRIVVDHLNTVLKNWDKNTREGEVNPFKPISYESSEPSKDPEYIIHNGKVVSYNNINHPQYPSIKNLKVDMEFKLQNGKEVITTKIGKSVAIIDPSSVPSVPSVPARVLSSEQAQVSQVPQVPGVPDLKVKAPDLKVPDLKSQNDPILKNIGNVYKKVNDNFEKFNSDQNLNSTDVMWDYD